MISKKELKILNLNNINDFYQNIINSYYNNNSYKLSFQINSLSKTQYIKFLMFLTYKGFSQLDKNEFSKYRGIK